LDQIGRIEKSPHFAGSDRLIQFLRFIVMETLKGNGSSLKEAVIGNVIYRRDPPYDPRIDSTVRVEARRLRRKLEDYYLAEGRGDLVRISLATGGYVPGFAATASDANGTFEKQVPLFEPGRGAVAAVLPFRALSQDPADDVFADGLTDEIIYFLSQTEGLRVISRSVVFQTKNKNYSVQALAQEFGADAFLQGTVRHDADQLKITVELCDPQGFVLWSDRFEQADQDKAWTQTKIARSVSSRVSLDSSAMRGMKIRPGPSALEANAKIYRARQLLDQQTVASLSKALYLFTEVSLSGTDYSRGFSGIADCHCDLYRLGATTHEAALAAARPAVRRALEIDPKSVEAQTSLAIVNAWLERDEEGAEEAFRNALQFGDNARTFRLYGGFLATGNRAAEAGECLEEARAVDAFSVHQALSEAAFHFRTGLLPQAPDAVASVPVHTEILVYQALTHIFKGSKEAGEALLTQLKGAVGKFPYLVFTEAEIAAWLGRPDKARALLDQRPASAKFFPLAALAAAVGDWDECLSLLETSANNYEAAILWLRDDPRFAALKGGPVFEAIVKGQAIG